MKKIFLSTLLVAALLASCKNNKEAEIAEAKETASESHEAAKYVVDTAATVIEWLGEKPTGQHHGTIDVSEGSFTYKDSLIESGSFKIDMKSITVLDLEGDQKANLENHLKGTVEGKEGDFFNVNKFPQATFELTGLTKDGNQTMMQGNLTIKEDTKNISFPVNISKDGEKLTIDSEEFTIDRTKWKVNYGSKSVFEGLGDKFISDNVQLKIKVIATKA